MFQDLNQDIGFGKGGKGGNLFLMDKNPGTFTSAELL